VRRLKSEGFRVRGADLKFNEFSEPETDDLWLATCGMGASAGKTLIDVFYEVCQLAADMSVADYIFTGKNGVDIMYNLSTINLNVLDARHRRNIKSVFYLSSACVCLAYNQEDPDNPNCVEESAYPAAQDSEYTSMNAAKAQHALCARALPAQSTLVKMDSPQCGLMHD
jgi:GDP-D-mannose 3',5'-epimerase